MKKEKVAPTLVFLAGAALYTLAPKQPKTEGKLTNRELGAWLAGISGSLLLLSLILDKKVA